MKKKILIGVGVYLGAGALVTAWAWSQGRTRNVLDAATFVPLWPVVVFNMLKSPTPAASGSKLPEITTSRAILPEHGKGPPIVYEGVRAPIATA